MFKIAFIGAGTVGSSVALLLKKKGYDITGVCSKGGISAKELSLRLEITAYEAPEEVLRGADVIVIATPDRSIEDIAVRLSQSNMVKEGQIFFHMSGALPIDVLNPLKKNKALIGSLHPLQSFAGIEQAMSGLEGSFFAVQGEPEAMEAAAQIVESLGGTHFFIGDKDKPLYHLAAVAASNYLVAVVHYAVEVFREIGMDDMEAVNALLPLIKGTVNNLEEMGPVKALTGPIARGDTNTVKCHLEALDNLNPEMKRLYRSLGQYTCKIALQKGTVDDNQADSLVNILNEGE